MTKSIEKATAGNIYIKAGPGDKVGSWVSPDEVIVGFRREQETLTNIFKRLRATELELKIKDKELEELAKEIANIKRLVLENKTDIKGFNGKIENVVKGVLGR